MFAFFAGILGFGGPIPFRNGIRMARSRRKKTTHDVEMFPLGKERTWREKGEWKEETNTG